MIRKILVVFLLITSTTLLAQKTSSSPYSFFGIGDEFSPKTVEQNSMGGIGVAYNHYKYLNFTNPAANAYLRYTTYAFGVLNNDLTIKSNGEKQKSTATSLSYIALGFPIGRNAGFSLGLQPVSSVGYSLVNNSLDNLTGNIQAATFYEGDGGVNRIYGSFGMRIFKDFSVGIEADYRFGSIENSITNQIVNVSLATKYKEDNTIRGGSVTLGTQYQKILKKNLYLNAGATFKLGNDLRVSGNEYLYSLTRGANGGDIPRDTLFSESLSGKYKMPLKSILGVGFGKFDKWYVGLEYENQDAIQVLGTLSNTNAAYRYEDSNSFSLGGYYLPKINSISSYWDRVTYRAGVRFEKTGLSVDGSGTNSNFTTINDFGMSFGLGLPLKQLSNVNLGVEFGKRGTTANNLIQENYVNFRLSLSLSESWFVKRKID
ncbi:hypothetical protein JL193_13430 [Polaribacter batillariae]|uniref:Long-chain fatty acid transport protein n=1 Tax=Polaribacter batillariae TaxID=2808900 RepID=A0ABX7SW75_9FLAO|nr:hypothetical protein [Polaribacter batillariae]QTD37108.1 hypothetical protein JL193_13430 [Polaribacter batillariae]